MTYDARHFGILPANLQRWRWLINDLSWSASWPVHASPWPIVGGKADAHGVFAMSTNLACSATNTPSKFNAGMLSTFDTITSAVRGVRSHGVIGGFPPNAAPDASCRHPAGKCLRRVVMMRHAVRWWGRRFPSNAARAHGVNVDFPPCRRPALNGLDALQYSGGPARSQGQRHHGVKAPFPPCGPGKVCHAGAWLGVNSGLPPDPRPSGNSG